MYCSDKLGTCLRMKFRRPLHHSQTQDRDDCRPLAGRPRLREILQRWACSTVASTCFFDPLSSNSRNRTPFGHVSDLKGLICAERFNMCRSIVAASFERWWANDVSWWKIRGCWGCNSFEQLCNLFSVLSDVFPQFSVGNILSVGHGTQYLAKRRRSGFETSTFHQFSALVADPKQIRAGLNYIHEVFIKLGG